MTFTTVDTRTLGAGANQNLTPYSYLSNEDGPVYIRIMSDEEDAHIFIDNFVATCYSLPTIPMDLPVTFDDPTINYGTIDFGGNASSFEVDPTDAGNNVVQTIKTVGSQTWAGTSLATFVNGQEIDLPVRYHSHQVTRVFSVRVWSPRSGIPVMLKIEDQSITRSLLRHGYAFSSECMDTLIFDYGSPTNGALNLSNTYDKVALFYDFNTAGANDMFYWMMLSLSQHQLLLQMDLPVTFDDASVNYGTIDFGGTASSIIVDPNDASNNVVQTEKTAGAQFAGTSLAIDDNGTQVAFANAIPFTAIDQRLSIRIWSPDAGVPGTVKIEDQTNGAIFVEAQDTIVVANAWDTLIFDYSNPTNGAVDLANTYDKVTLFYYFEDPAGVGAGQVFYWDDESSHQRHYHLWIYL